MRWLIVMLLLAVLLVGCGLQKGYVTAKHYYPAWTQFETGQNCTGTGTQRQCTSYIYPVYHQAEWTLDLSSCDYSERHSSNCDTGTVDVDEATWDKTQVGEYVNFGGQ